MATFTKRIDSAIRVVLDNYISIRSPNWTASTSGGVFGKATEEELFPGEFYGGTYNISFRFTGVTIPQGSTITSAKITFTTPVYGNSAKQIYLKIYGVDEDDTAEFVTSPIDTARTRTHTTASVDWDPNLAFTYANETFDSADFTSVVQEIVDRGGWTSGNDLGLYFQDDGTSVDNTLSFKSYSGFDDYDPLLTITYLASSESRSPSASPSPSPSRSPSLSGSESSSPSLSPSLSPSSSESRSPSFSPSPSASISLSPSTSPSATPSFSPSASPSPMIPFFGMRVAKEGQNALMTDSPYNLKFDSRFGTLKYFTKQALTPTIDANAGDIACTATYTHDLGYYPFVEVFVNVYIGTSDGTYEYCPFFGSGATVEYSANYKITTTGITVYGMINGVSSSLWHFDFLIFIYKNNLQLS